MLFISVVKLCILSLKVMKQVFSDVLPVITKAPELTGNQSKHSVRILSRLRSEISIYYIIS